MASEPASPSSYTRPQRLAGFLIKLALPRQTLERSRRNRVILMSLVVGFALLIMLASLPVVGRWFRNHTVGHLEYNPVLGMQLEGISNAIELLGVVFIGGAVFSSQLVEFVQSKAKEYEDAIASAIGHESRELRDDLELQARELEEIIDRAQWAGFGRTLLDGWRAAWKLYAMIFDQLPGHYGRYAWTTIVTKFPGGFFGLVAFLLFAASACLKTAKLWVEMGV